MLESMQMVEVKLVSMSRPCSERTRPENRNRPANVNKNTVMLDTTGAEIALLPSLTATTERG